MHANVQGYFPFFSKNVNIARWVGLTQLQITLNALLYQKQLPNSAAQEVDLWPMLCSGSQILIYCAMSQSEASLKDIGKLANSENPSYDAKLQTTVQTELWLKVASTYFVVKVVLSYCQLVIVSYLATVQFGTELQIVRGHQ